MKIFLFLILYFFLSGVNAVVPPTGDQQGMAPDFGSSSSGQSLSSQSSSSPIADLLNGNSGNLVNDFTGQAAFSIDLGGIENFNNIAYPIRLDYYGGNIRKKNERPLKKFPVNWIGLGFHLGVPQIVAKHRKTISIHDDTYMFSMDGKSFQKLIQRKSASHCFFPESEPMLEVCRNVTAIDSSRFHLGPTHAAISHEKGVEEINHWTVTLLDKSKYILGTDRGSCVDAQSNPDATLCHGVVRGKLINQADYSNDHSKLPIAWYLSEIRDNSDTGNYKIHFRYSKDWGQKSGAVTIPIERGMFLDSIYTENIYPENTHFKTTVFKFFKSVRAPDFYYDYGWQHPGSKVEQYDLDSIQFLENGALYQTLQFTKGGTGANKRLLKAIHVQEPVFGEKKLIADFTYDVHGRLTKYTDQNGISAIFTQTALAGINKELELDLNDPIKFPGVSAMQKPHIVFQRQIKDKYYVHIEDWDVNGNPAGGPHWPVRDYNSAWTIDYSCRPGKCNITDPPSEVVLEFKREGAYWKLSRTMDPPDNMRGHTNTIQAHLSPDASYLIWYQGHTNSIYKPYKLYLYDISGEDPVHSETPSFQIEKLGSPSIGVNWFNPRIFTFNDWFVLVSGATTENYMPNSMQFFYRDSAKNWTLPSEHECPIDKSIFDCYSDNHSGEDEDVSQCLFSENGQNGWQVFAGGTDLLVAFHYLQKTVRVFSYQNHTIKEIHEGIPNHTWAGAGAWECQNYSGPTKGNNFEDGMTLVNASVTDDLITLHFNRIFDGGPVHKDGLFGFTYDGFELKQIGMIQTGQDGGLPSMVYPLHNTSALYTNNGHIWYADLLNSEIKTFASIPDQYGSGNYGTHFKKLGDWIVPIEIPSTSLAIYTEFRLHQFYNLPKYVFPDPPNNGGTGNFGFAHDLNYQLVYQLTGTGMDSLVLFSNNPSQTTGWQGHDDRVVTYRSVSGTINGQDVKRYDQAFKSKKVGSAFTSEPISHPFPGEGGNVGYSLEILDNGYVFAKQKVHQNGWTFFDKKLKFVIDDDVDVVSEIKVQTGGKNPNSQIDNKVITYDYVTNFDGNNDGAIFLNWKSKLPNFKYVKKSTREGHTIKVFNRDVIGDTLSKQNKNLLGTLIKEVFHPIAGNNTKEAPGGSESVSSYVSQPLQGIGEISGKDEDVYVLRNTGKTVQNYYYKQVLKQALKQSHFTLKKPGQNPDFTPLAGPKYSIHKQGAKYRLVVVSYLHEYEPSARRDLITQISTYLFNEDPCPGQDGLFPCDDNLQADLNQIEQAKKGIASEYFIYNVQGLLERAFTWAPRTKLGFATFINNIAPPAPGQNFDTWKNANLPETTGWEQVQQVLAWDYQNSVSNFKTQGPVLIKQREVVTTYYYGGGTANQLIGTITNAGTYNSTLLTGEESINGTNIQLGSFGKWAITGAAQVTSEIAHCGKSAIRLLNGSLTRNLYLREKEDYLNRKKGMVVSAWVFRKTNAPSQFLIRLCYSGGGVSSTINMADEFPQGIPDSKWVKLQTEVGYRTIISNNLFSQAGSTDYFQVTFTNSSNSKPLYIDDVRVYPSDAMVTTYNYDELNNITSVLNEHNDPEAYEYDVWQNKIATKNNNSLIFSTGAAFNLPIIENQTVE